MDFFNRTLLQNPINIKRLLGDLPTSNSSTKNVGIILVVITILLLTFTRVWNLVNGFIGNAIISGILLGIIYLFIVFRLFALTVFEERKHKKAFLDFMDNKTSDISVVWEVQDVKEHTTENGTKFSYIDYIDGRRVVILKCVYGSIINKDDEDKETHVDVVTNALQQITKMGFSWHPVSKPIKVNDDKMLNVYYKSIREFDDLDFVDIFTEILDTIDFISSNVSSVYAVFFRITATGKHRHGMFERLESVPNLFAGKTAFDFVNFVDTEHEIDYFIADELGLGLYDREELIMMKYKDRGSIGGTSVISAYNAEGELLKQFNKEVNIERKVTMQSFDLQTEVKSGSLKKNENNEPMEIPKHKITIVEESLEEIKINTTKSDSEFMRLMYEDEEVTLG